MQRVRKIHRRVLFYIRTELKALWFIISCAFKSVKCTSALKKRYKRMKSRRRQTDLALPDARNNINSELYWRYKVLCNVWHLLAFRLGQHLSKSLTSVLRVCFCFVFFICALELRHIPKAAFVKDADHVCSNISPFSLLLGRPRVINHLY